MSGRDLSITHGPAVTPFQSLMIQSMHTGSGPCAHMYRGAVVLCETIICARFFFLQMREVHIIICMSDLFLPEVHLELWKPDCDDCELFCDCIKTLSFTRAFHSAHKRYFLPAAPFCSLLKSCSFVVNVTSVSPRSCVRRLFGGLSCEVM